jgi:hypothetical protein
MAEVPEPDDFLSGSAGMVVGIRATSAALVSDAVADALAAAAGQPWRLRRTALTAPRRRVLVLGVERPNEPNLLDAARRKLLSSRHEVRFAGAVAGERGKFENLNALLTANPPAAHDWLLVVDDDVALPRGFLDVFIFLAERFQLRLAQPAHRRRSHAAWEVTRRRPGAVVRETAFVEIGPVIAFHRDTFDLLLPFPELRAGWGLDLYWSALAGRQGWKLGVVDATPIRHGLREIASSYDRSDAIAEARRFLADRPYTTAAEAQRTIVTHRTWN